MDPSNMRIFTAFAVVYLVAQTKAYPMQGWPVYPQASREYPDDDYYYTPKVQYYYDAPAMNVPEVYGQVSYPYYYDPYSHLANEAPKAQEERLAALPIGQETWFESEASPRWRSNDVDDVSAAFLDNLILTQMAQDAQRRRENSRAAFSQVDYEDKDSEDEDVKELKALASKTMYHSPMTAPKFDDDDYADDGFINWNGNKRSVSTAAPVTASTENKRGQDEVAVGRPASTNHYKSEKSTEEKETFYNTISKLLAKNAEKSLTHSSTKPRRIEKRFVAGDRDLVLQLQGLKHGMAT